MTREEILFFLDYVNQKTGAALYWGLDSNGLTKEEVEELIEDFLAYGKTEWPES